MQKATSASGYHLVLQDLTVKRKGSTVGEIENVIQRDIGVQIENFPRSLHFLVDQFRFHLELLPNSCKPRDIPIRPPPRLCA
jgi:hypothetical protein